MVSPMINKFVVVTPSSSAHNFVFPFSMHTWLQEKQRGSGEDFLAQRE